MKKKSIERIMAWALAVSMTAGTFAQPLAVYAEDTAPAYTSQDVYLDDGAAAQPTPVPTDESTTQEPDPTAAPTATPDPELIPAPESTAAPTETPAPTAAPTPQATTLPEEDADSTNSDTPADVPESEDEETDQDETDTPTEAETPADLQSCLALLASASLQVDAQSIDPELRDETMALADEITVNDTATLQALVNAAVLNHKDEKVVTVDVPEGQYTGTLVIPEAIIVATNDKGNTTNVDYSDKKIILNMQGSTLTVPTDAAAGISVFGDLTINGGTIQAAQGCTATRGAQVPLGGSLTLDGTTISGFTYAGPGAGVYVKGTALLTDEGWFDVALDEWSDPITDGGQYVIKKLQRKDSTTMESRFTMQGGSKIANCTSGGNGAALYAQNAAILDLTGAEFAENSSNGYGGAVYLGTGVALTLNNGVTFTGNHAAKDGGALYLANQYTLHVKDHEELIQVPVTLTGDETGGPVFADNSADGSGGALAMDPAFDQLTDNTIRYVTFTGNTSGVRGGAIAFNSTIAENTLENCAFTGNQALSGGAVYYPNNMTAKTDWNPTYNITGSTFTNNQATVSTSSNGYGGAVLVQIRPDSDFANKQTVTANITGNTFDGNTAGYDGGAVAAILGGTGTNAAGIQLNLDGNTFTGNATTASDYDWAGGGAVYLGSYAQGTFTGNTFTNNTSARRGGAVFIINDRAIEGRTHIFGDPDDAAKGNTFIGNHANSDGGAVYCGVTDNSNGTTTHTYFYGGEFKGNTTNSRGGAAYLRSSTTREDDAALFDGVTFEENEAQRSGMAGALDLFGSRYTLQNCTFTGNKTEQDGAGAILADWTRSIVIRDSSFTGNIAGNVRNGGARGGVLYTNYGTCELTNDTFTNNKAADIGGAVFSLWGQDVAMAVSGCEFTGNHAGAQGGGISLWGGTLDIANTNFEGNTSNSRGGAIYTENRTDNLRKETTLTIHEGCRFTNNKGSDGGAVYMTGNNNVYQEEDGTEKYHHGKVDILGTADAPVIFQNNQATSGSGGAIVVGSRIDLTLQHATLDGNSATNSGGAIYQGGNGNITRLTDCKFTDNTAKGNGGALFADGAFIFRNEEFYPNPADIQAENCTFTGNKASSGGAIALSGNMQNNKDLYTYQTGTLTVKNSTLDGNAATSYGGALCAYANWDVTLSGADITNNTAAYGGALLSERCTIVLVDGTTLTGNTATTNGGAIYVWQDITSTPEVYPASVTAKDCTIRQNTAGKGGIAYVTQYASFAVEQGVTLAGNTAMGDVYVAKNAGDVTLAAADTLQGGHYTAWRKDRTDMLEGDVTNDSTADHYYDLYDANGGVVRVTGGSQEEKKYPTLQAALDDAAARSGDDVRVDLLADLNEKVTANTEGTPITLNLNHYTFTGKITLTNAQNTNAFTLADDALDDAKPGSSGGQFVGIRDDFGIEMRAGAGKDVRNTLLLKGGTLSNFTRTVNAGDNVDITWDGAEEKNHTQYGTYVNANSRVTVNGGSFHDSASNVFLLNGQNSSLTITGGEFYKNSTNNGAVAWLNYNSSLTITGGDFHDNTVSGKGAVIATNQYGNTVTIAGGDFYNNKAADGGVVALNICNRSDCTNTFTMTGGTMRENTATSTGGAIWAGCGADKTNTSSLSILGGTITGNTANSGGALYAPYKIDLTIGGGDGTNGAVYNNNAQLASNLLLAGEGSTLTVAAGGLLYGGTSAGDVLFDKGGKVTLAETGSLYLDPVPEADRESLVWLKNQETTGQTSYEEDAPAQTSYRLAHGGTETGVYAARIEDTRYYTIAQAMAAAKAADGTDDITVYLLRDQTENFTVNQPQHNVALNLNGYTLTGQITVHDGNNPAKTTFTLCDETGAPDYKPGSTGGVLTGTGIGIYAKSHNTMADIPTIKLEGSLALTGFAGHAIYAENNNSIVVNGVTFRDNNNTEKSSNSWLTAGYGAAICVYGSGSLQADNCTFTNNTVDTYDGGAIYMGNGTTSTISLTNCTFEKNSAGRYGGAACLRGRSVNLANNKFIRNTLTGSNNGGALYLYVDRAADHTDDTVEATLTGNEFTGNTAKGSGGAMYLTASSNDVVTLFEQNTFTQNQSGSSAAGVWVYRGVLRLGAHNVFENNNSYGSGTALYVDYRDTNYYATLETRYTEEEDLPKSDYTVFKDNICGQGRYSDVYGAVVLCGGPRHTLRFATFEGNQAANIGGWSYSGIFIYGAPQAVGTRNVTIDHCDFTNNKSGSGVLAMWSNDAPDNLITLTNLTFTHNTCNGAVMYSNWYNSITAENVTVEDTQGTGRAIEFYAGSVKTGEDEYTPVHFDFTNVNILNNKNCGGSPVYLYCGNNDSSSGYLRQAAQATMTWKDSTISGNASKNVNWAGAIYVTKLLLTMDDCKITDNSGNYAALYVNGPANPVGYGPQQETTLTLSNCTVSNNKSTYGAGIQIAERDLGRTTANITDCNISDNVSQGAGAGIRVGALGTLNMQGTTVSGNTSASFGGGIYSDAYDTQDGASRINLTDCTLTGNKANYGGAVYLTRDYRGAVYSSADSRKILQKYASDSQSLNINGGTITGNMATTNGGGICTDIYDRNSNYSTLCVKVTATDIENNRAQLGQDVFAYKAVPTTSLYLPQASTITNEPASRWLNENTGRTLQDEPVNYDIIQRTYPLTLSVPKTETDVAQIVLEDGTIEGPYSLQEAMDLARQKLAEDPNAKLTVQLIKNTNSSTLVSAGTNVTLDLNGCTITGIGGTSALTVEDSTLTITDSTNSGSSTISGTATDGGALLLRSNANVTVDHVTLTGSRAARYGGGAYLTGGASLTLGTGAAVTGCEAARGGAVYVNDGTFTQKDDAAITNCKTFTNATFGSTGRGGAVYVEKGTYNLEDKATVTGCTAPDWGTVCIAGYGEFNMTGGKISGNTAKYGGGVFTDGTMTLAGGEISGNTATSEGGGVYQNSGTSLMRDGTITGNTAYNGGGWRIYTGNCLMRGGSITGNTAKNCGGGLYQSPGTFTVNGGSITKNEAPTGGGVYFTNGTFNFQGGGLYGNVSTGTDSGNDLYSAGKNGKVNLIAAEGMKNDKYNVWRDDRYPYSFTKGYNNTSDKIAAEGGDEGGKYLTSTVTNVNDVQLTAFYYGSDKTDIASNDMFVSMLQLTAQESGNGTNDAYDKTDGVITAQDVLDKKATVEGVEKVERLTETYPLEYQNDQNVTTRTEQYLQVKYTNGKTEKVRPNTPLAWTAGNDSSLDNRLIRSFSKAHYTVHMQIESAEMKKKLNGTTQRLWLRIRVPCNAGDVSISGVGSTFVSSLSYYDPTQESMILEGYQDIQMDTNATPGSGIFDPTSKATIDQQFIITVGGMHNGDKVSPVVEAWFDNSSYQNYQTPTNPHTDKISLAADPMVVSAKAAYNVAVKNQKNLKRVGYFDIKNKTEITQAEYNDRKAAGDQNVVYGMMAGYGFGLQLRNQDTTKKLKGIEIPTEDISFTVGMHGGLYYDGQPLTYKADSGKTGNVTINPILWAYKANDRGEDRNGHNTTDNTAGINMYWNDEDDLTKDTHYIQDFPSNITADHSGGVWSVSDPNENGTYKTGDGSDTAPQTQLTFHVKGYTMKPIGSVENESYTFSAGYLQVLIPLDMDQYDLGDSYDGFLQADMHVAAGEFTMDTTKDLCGKDPTTKDAINSYYNLTNEDTLKEYAKNETYYDDNYNNSDTVGMNINKATAGNGSFISKSTYWLGSDGSTVLNASGRKELGSNVTGVGSQLFMNHDLAFSSESVTPSNKPDAYLYDQQVDQLTEYYYLTGFDALMKFDPDVMEPVTYKENGEEIPVTSWSASDVNSKLGDITLLRLSDNGSSDWDTGSTKLTKNYELTILYAAKKNETAIGNGNTGSGWVYSQWNTERSDLDNSQPRWSDTDGTRDDGGTADMDKYSFDNQTDDGNCLVYYNTLQELKDAGHTCVAVLYQVRNCCIRNGREVEVGHKMQVSKDTAKIGRSYATTVDMRGWTTYRPFFRKPLESDGGWKRLYNEDGQQLQDRRSLVYQGLIQGGGNPAKAPESQILHGTGPNGGTASWEIGLPTVFKSSPNSYQKTQYSNGYEVGGSHSGYRQGNTVLIATQNASIKIETTDVGKGGNITRTDYLLDNGERTVSVRVTPKITMHSSVNKDLPIFDGKVPTEIQVAVTLPKDLTLQQGTLDFDYANSGYGKNDLTWQMQYQYQDDNNEWHDFDFTEDYVNNYQQRKTRLLLTTTVSDVQKTLPVINFKAGIGYPADPDKDIANPNPDSGTDTWYSNLTLQAEVHSTYEDNSVNAALGRKDSTEITVYKNSRTVINKTAKENLVEIGQDLTYTLSYKTEERGELELCDVLPYNSKEFHGAYALKSVKVEVQSDSDKQWQNDQLEMAYGKSTTAAFSDGVLDRKNTLEAAKTGTELTNQNCTITSTGTEGPVTYTLNDPVRHTASGTSDLGTLYIKLKQLPASTIKVTVMLTPKQEISGQDSQLLPDSDKNKTTQQPGDVYTNVYFVKTGTDSFITSPAAAIKVRSRSISGLAWLDQNQDGVYTTRVLNKESVGSDKLLSGVTVKLLQTDKPTQDAEPVLTIDGTDYYSVTDTLGNVVADQTTDKDGRYSFVNLPKGSYYVAFTDDDNKYTMADGSEKALPFGKLSLTKADAKGDTSNKASGRYAEDGTTLTAGLTKQIDLGDAMLTGRDDRTNVNAGFYYTELRFAKVWYNVPSAAEAAKAKVQLTLTAKTKDDETYTADYTLSAKDITGPETETKDRFGKFQSDKVLVGDRAEDQRMVRWSTEAGVPLQAENAKGSITYTLTAETHLAKNCWAADATFVQDISKTEPVNSGPDSDNSVIATRMIAENTARTYDIEITKLSDITGLDIPKGAKFEAKREDGSITRQSTEVPCTQDDKNFVRYLLQDLCAGTYTLRETWAPLGYAKDPTTYTLTIRDTDEDGSLISPIITLQDGDKLLYTVTVTAGEDGTQTVSVEKAETDSTARAEVTGGECLAAMDVQSPQSNLPIRMQIDLNVTDSYLFSLPFTGGSGAGRGLLLGAAVMGLAAAALAVTVTRRKKRRG